MSAYQEKCRTKITFCAVITEMDRIFYNISCPAASVNGKSVYKLWYILPL